MKIGIFVGRLDPNTGGESSLTKTILQEIKSYNNKHEFVFLYTNESKSLKKLFINEYEYINISKCRSTQSIFLNGLVDSLGCGSNRFFVLDKIAQKEKIDMFYFAAPIFAPTSLPYIFTVWDLGHRTTPCFPEVNDDWGYREKMYKKMLPRATYILTANNTGKNEINRFYLVDENRIKIVPFPITYFCYEKEKKPSFINNDDNFFFYPAQFWSHKNHIVIIEALLILRDKYELHPTIYFTGSDKGNLSYIKKKIDEYHLENQVYLTGFIEDDELVYMYKHSRALVYASLMGPNNLPPQEALYLGCPIVLSNIPGHREQMGDLAIYFDGYNPEDLAEKMKMCFLEDKHIETKPINKNEILNSNYFSNVLSLFNDIERDLYRYKSF